MGVHHDVRLLRLPEDLVQPDGRHALGGDQVAQKIARPDRRQLVDVAHEHEPRAVGQRLDQRLHEHDVHHGYLVQDHRVALERIGQVAGKGRAPARAEARLEQAVDGLGLHAGQLGQAFGCAAGRRSEQRVQAERLEHLQNPAHRGRFARARPAGQDDQTAARRARDGLPLLFRIREFRAVHERAQQLVHIEIVFEIALRHMAQHLREIGLRVVHAAQVDRIPSRDVLAHQTARRGQPVDARERPVLVKHHIVIRQQRAHRMHELFHRDKGVPVVQIEGERIGHARIRALVGQQAQPELHGKPVRQLEIHIIIGIAQQIGVFTQRVDRAVVQALVQQRRQRDRQAVLAQKIHQQAHLALLDELPPDLARLFRGDAADIGQAFGLVREHVERVLPELLRNAGGQPRPDAADQARAQIFGNAPRGRGQPPLKRGGLELLAVGRMGHPHAGQRDLLPQPDVGKGAGGGHLRAALRRQAKHRVSVLRIVKNDLLHRAADDHICFFLHAPPFPFSPNTENPSAPPCAARHSAPVRRRSRQR